MKLGLQSRRGVIGLIAAVVCLALGLYLIIDHRASVPPDTDTAEPAELVPYMLSDHFNSLSDAQQRRFTEESMRRYALMDEQQRAAVDARVGQLRQDDPDALREQAMRIWKGYVVAEAEQYVKLPPEHRERWLNGRIAVWKLMGSDGRGPRDEQSRRRQKENEGPLTAERQGRIVKFFQTEVFPRSTSRERALVMTLARDAGARMRQ